MCIGSWSSPLEPSKLQAENYLNLNTHPEIQYSKEDIKHIEKWGE